MPAKSVCVNIGGAPPPLGKVFVDEVEFTGCIDVQPGQHTLVWQVVGFPGQQYTVNITSPDDAKWTGTFVIPVDHDMGQFIFSVSV